MNSLCVLLVFIAAVERLVNCTDRTQALTECTNNSDCFPAMKCDNGTCVCEAKQIINMQFSGLLKCDKQGVSVSDCNCFTFDNNTKLYTVGACMENCMNGDSDFYNNFYHPTFPPSSTNVTEIMCGKYNRGGRLCGKCLPSFSPQAYTYSIKCVHCPEGNTNLWKYFAASLLPLTCFYFLIVFFKINTTSSHLHGYIIFAQTLCHPAFGRLVYIAQKANSNFTIPTNILFILYGIWDLSFFQMFNSESICLNMSPLSVRALDYSIAVFPLVLTVISYVLIELHDKNYRIIVLVWKPFRSMFILFRRNWDIRTSIIDAYATFYQLSFFKILCITQDFLTPIYAHTSEKKKKLVLFYDATVDYFGEEHLPYAIPAIIIAFFTIILPVALLLCYQCNCFQTLLSRCHLSSHILQTLMNSFQSSYKDGTEPATNDCRWFAAFDLFVRIVFCFVYSITLGSIFFSLAAVLMFFVILLVVNIQPYNSRVKHYFKIDLSFYCFIGLFFVTLASANTASWKAHNFVPMLYYCSVVIVMVPLIYMLCISIHWLFSRRKFGKTLIRRLQAWRSGYDSLEDSLPHRLLHPDHYVHQGLPNAASSNNSLTS